MSHTKLNEWEQSVYHNIDTHGWHGMHVFDPDGEQPHFSYSVGFTKTLNAPEFIIFGLTRELKHNMLWEIFKQIKAGRVPRAGMRWADLLEGFECVSLQAAHPDLFIEYATSAKWLWQHEGHEGQPPVMQMVWPGARDGLFPWDQGCSQIVKDEQPKLWADAL